MPELPDVVVYVDALRARILGQRLEAVRIGSPFVLRSVDPPIASAAGRRVTELRRLGKRIVIGLEPDFYLVIHLMIAGRLRWKRRGAAIPGRIGLAAFDFPSGTVLFTEAGTRRRASLHFVQGEAALDAHDRGGLEVLEADAAAFRAALRRENHTLKRALTDPRILSGIGNAYSDEILHAAKLSPFALTSSAERCRPGSSLRSDAGHPHRLGRPPPRGAREWLSRESDRLPRCDGSARQVPQTVSRVRITSPTDSLRAERSELLRDVPDGRQGARRPLAVTVAQGRLAAIVG